MGGRRWYYDHVDQEKYDGEHADAERIEYMHSLTNPMVGGSRGTFSQSQQELLRFDTNLDEPGRDGKPETWIGQYRVMGGIWNLFTYPGNNFRNLRRFADSEKALSITEKDEEKYGLPRDTIRWVYLQGKTELMKELDRRQCRSRLNSIKDCEGLREALFDELRREKAYSPTRNHVMPGFVASLSGSEFEVERDADTDVPLAVALVAEDLDGFSLRTRKPTARVGWSGLSVKFFKHLSEGARRVLRGARIIRVVGPKYPEIAAAYGVTRYPTTLWLEPRTGRELAREVGVFSANTLVEVTKRLREGRLLPPPEERDRRLALEHGGRSPLALPTHTSTPSMWAAKSSIAMM